MDIKRRGRSRMQLLAIRPVPLPRTPSSVVRPSARGLRTQYRDTHLPSFPAPSSIILYCLEAAFLAAEPLSLVSGSGLTGLWERRMALARETAASRRSPR